ncbi:MAG TPA: hypothetical protein PKA00_18145 [Saprospiraceae bacterium]|nr:hypothetical protein [Saprospiraceae bacterium]HMQ84840.1 hypothetical protein [Saprospiraceae bacterium]
MSALEIKGGIYELISKVDDKQLLLKLYKEVADLIAQNQQEQDFWNELSEWQQMELESAIEESQN